MRYLPSILLYCLLLLGVSNAAEASWLIDRERFHASAHGQISCQECHGDIATEPFHPNPDHVNRRLKDFFQPEQCTACHETVLEEADASGIHGGEEITDKQTFTNCINCHTLHYQLSYSEPGNEVDFNQPQEKKCSLCHEYREKLPEFSLEDAQCIQCHGAINPENPKAVEKISRLCFACHSSDNAPVESSDYPLIETATYHATAHADIACTACHPDAAGFEHSKQKPGDCRQCHHLHDEKTAHDAHLRISCQACHLNWVTPVKTEAGGMVNWERKSTSGGISRPIHATVRSSDETHCKRCHASGNSLGAAAMVLPAKSMICMPCHAATFSIEDATTIIALGVFFLGFFSISGVWFSGSITGVEQMKSASKFKLTFLAISGTLLSKRIVSIIKALLLDGVLQRRLYQTARSRWLIHSLVFYPFLFRFCWGLIALLASLWLPQWQGTWVMLNKDHPLTAFLFDLTAVLTVLGVVLMIIRKYRHPFNRNLTGLPKIDWLGYSLMGAIMFAGFILEGMRIAMTGPAVGSQYAFLGYAISKLFTSMDLTGVYGYMWYGHTILTGAFIAYMPFSRMVHMIMAPISLAMNAADRHNQHAIVHAQYRDNI